jgi:hypothetical protein
MMKERWQRGEEDVDLESFKVMKENNVLVSYVCTMGTNERVVLAGSDNAFPFENNNAGRRYCTFCLIHKAGS